MQLPRFRFTIRRMMVAVAIAGLAIGVVRLRQVGTTHATKAAAHARQAAAIRARIDTLSEVFSDGKYRLSFGKPHDDKEIMFHHSGGQGFPGLFISDEPCVFGYISSGFPEGARAVENFPEGARTLEGWRRLATWHHLLYQKCERAARFPWLPVAPDRPEPE